MESLRQALSAFVHTTCCRLPTEVILHGIIARLSISSSRYATCHTLLWHHVRCLSYENIHLPTGSSSWTGLGRGEADDWLDVSEWVEVLQLWEGWRYRILSLRLQWLGLPLV